MRKRIICLVLVALMLGSLPVAQATATGRVFDPVHLLSAAETAAVEERIAAFQAATAMDFVLLTNQEPHAGVTQKTMADTFYDQVAISFDERNSGILMLIDMNERQLYLSTTGRMIDILTDDRLNDVLDLVAAQLSRGQYASAALDGIDRILAYVKANDAGSAEATYAGTFTGLDDALRTVTFSYSDAYFQSDSAQMNPALARASMALSALAYDQTSLEKTLKAMGFDHIQSAYGDQEQGDGDSAAVMFAVKRVELNGALFDLFAIIVRGTRGAAEWVSNFDIGSDTTHAGFTIAEQEVLSRFRDYLNGLEKAGTVDRDRDNNLLWMTGHSRGAAVVNLLAADIDDYFTYATTEHLYAYTFACPNVTAKPVSGNPYPNVFNFNIQADVITGLPLASWGYRRNGATFALDASGGDEAAMRRFFQDRTGITYQGTSQAECDELLALIGDLAPSVQAYYGTYIRTQANQLFPLRTLKPAGLFRGIAYLLGDQLPMALVYLAPELMGGEVLTVSAGEMARRIVRHFYDGSRVLPNIPQAHCVEAYLAWMDALAGATVGEPEPETEPTALPGTGEDAPIADATNDLSPETIRRLLASDEITLRRLLGADSVRQMESGDPSNADGSLTAWLDGDNCYCVTLADARYTVGSARVGQTVNEMEALWQAQFEWNADESGDVWCLTNGDAWNGMRVVLLSREDGALSDRFREENATDLETVYGEHSVVYLMQFWEVES